MLYRLNLAAQTTESFVDFFHEQRYFVAPTLSWQLGDRTKLTFTVGHVIPSERRVSIKSVVDTVKAAYSKVPELKVEGIYPPRKPDAAYELILESPEGETTEIYVNPYSGAIMGSLEGDRTFTTFTLELHSVDRL